MNFCRKVISGMTMLILCLLIKTAGAQRVFINSPSTLYEVTGGLGSCNYVPIPLCAAIQSETLFSIAYHKEVLYVLSPNFNFFRVDINNPTNCNYITSVPNRYGGISALTVDKNGLLWGIYTMSLELFSLNPVTKEFRDHGRVPMNPSGDMVFYHDKMLYAAADNNIYEVNMADPSNSTVFMSTNPYSFYGVISFPDQCKQNKLYGIASGAQQLVELDMENRTVIGPICNLPYNIYDAASEVEDGNTIGITVHSMRIKAPCLPTENTGDIQVNATSAGTGSLTYTLDNGQTNTTGSFTNLPIGTYSLNITNALCSRDTSFVIARGVQPVTLSLTDPTGCGLNNGSISVAAASPYQLSYSLNNGSAQTGNQFDNLPAGTYSLRISDEGGCMIDTSTTLRPQTVPDYIRDIELQNTVCESKTGSIKINGPTDVRTSLNNGPYSSQQHHTQLDAGIYKFSIQFSGNCIFDTVLTITKLMDSDPIVDVTTKDQLCNERNGVIHLTATGANAPYHFSINNNTFTPSGRFEGLGPGVYPLRIQNVNKCEWQTSAEIRPYLKESFDGSINIGHPTCEVLNDGRVTIIVTGPQAPYYFSLNGTFYQNNTISNLVAGKYELKYYNRDHCEMKTEQVELINKYSPVCDNAFLPSAFTPNGDGLNDVFKPVLGSPVTSGVTLTIYNRHGQVLFRSTNSSGWDGTYKGVKQDSGTYVWTLEHKTYAGQKTFQKGTVTLIR